MRGSMKPANGVTHDGLRAARSDLARSVPGRFEVLRSTNYAKTVTVDPKPQPQASNIQPVVFVFPLFEVGEWLEKKIPAKYAGAACYWYRSAHEESFEALGAIEEPEMGEKQASKLLSLVAEYVDACDLRSSIYTDDEHAELEEPDDDQCGFHAGVSLEEATRALEAGGFRVLRAPFPQTLASGPGSDEQRYPKQLDALVARIEHHLTFASIPLALRTLEESKQLTLQLRQIMSLLGKFLGSELDDRLAARLGEAYSAWPRTHHDKMHLVLAEMDKWALIRSQALNPNTARLRAALPPVADERVARALQHLAG